MTERYVTLAEVKQLLEEVSESRKGTAELLEDEDVLLASQKAALDHAQKVSKLSLEDSEKLMEELKGLEFITDDIAVKIVDVLPRFPEDVHAIFYRAKLDDSEIKQIIEMVNNYI
jgi:DNA-directed RNA polymerase subunit F